MNYIRHLTAFLQKAKSDNRLNSSHVSLYLALFHYWNLNVFENPLSVNRAQMLELSKIGSQHTYYRCLKELHLFGYIRYFPSHHPAKGCLVSLCTFDITPGNTCANMHNHGSKNDITLAAKMQPSINNTNNKTYSGETTQTQKSIFESLNPKRESNKVKSKRKKVPPKKVEDKVRIPSIGGEKIEIPPSLDKVKIFFKLESFPELEAHKFFNHFQSNGWKVGGKSPMKDWHAAARNWMLNTQKFANPGKPNSTNLNTNKRYDIPL